MIHFFQITVAHNHALPAAAWYQKIFQNPLSSTIYLQERVFWPFASYFARHNKCWVTATDASHHV